VLEREQERWVYVWKWEGKGQREENKTHLIDKHAHNNTTLTINPPPPYAPPHLNTYYKSHFLSYLLDDGSMDFKPHFAFFYSVMGFSKRAAARGISKKKK